VGKRSPCPYAAIRPLLEGDRKHIKRGLKLPFHGPCQLRQAFERRF
jgi:hypothetical protein